MPSYRSVISRQKVYQLEEYLFRLGEYIDTCDFKDLKSLQQNNILREMPLGVFSSIKSILLFRFYQNKVP